MMEGERQTIVPMVQFDEVVSIVQSLHKIVQALKTHGEKITKEYLQTFTPRYLINSIYNESMSDLAHEYQLVCRLISEFPIYVQDALNAIYKKTVEVLVADNYQPADIVALASLFRETVSMVVMGTYALLAMSDALVANHYQQGIIKGATRPLKEKMKYGVINIPTKNEFKSIDTFMSKGNGNDEKPSDE